MARMESLEPIKPSGRGGKRPGAGKKRKDPLGARRRSRTITCTEAELAQVKNFLKELRANPKAASTEWTD